ncbi:MAG: DUF2332 family protein [Longimicrobiales bacterium]|nr:DUF2332 family protein [Longimicrobiales bacterium]
MNDDTEPSDPLAGLLEDLESQRKFVRDRVPVYARILDLLPDVLPRERLADAWKGRTFGAWYERPLLILASLRDDALEEGDDHPLHATIGSGATGTGTAPSAGAEDTTGPPNAAEGPRAVTRDALREALDPGRPVWDKLRNRHVQTNETSRAVAWMWPAHLIRGVDPKRPLHLFDVGASAGLNLVADALARIWTRSDDDEQALAIDPLPEVGIRRGYDIRPLDPDDEESARWLRACVWPGQDDRLRRLDRAIEAWRSTDPRPRLVQASAEEVPDRLPRDEEGWMLAYQTVMRDYVSPGEWERYSTGMRRWLEASPSGRALWVELEVEESARKGGPPAAITVHLSNASLVLATCEPHPKRLEVKDDAVEELVRRLR